MSDYIPGKVIPQGDRYYDPDNPNKRFPENGWGGGASNHQLEDHRHMPLFLINGMIPPDNFRYGYTEDTEQLVKSQRNSKRSSSSTKSRRSL